MAQNNELDREKAKRLYIHGGRTAKEIAEALGYSLNTVKSWQKRDSWAKARKMAGATSRKKVASKKVVESKKVATENTLKKKQGAPKNNFNAVGHGAPKGNKNAMKHGGYCLDKWGVLDDEEKDFIKAIAVDDAEAILIEEIEMYYIRERRILKAIQKYTKNPDGSTREMYISRQVASEKRLATDPNKKVGVIEMHSTKENVSNIVLRLEQELSKVQRGKAASIDSLIKYRASMSSEEENNVINYLSGIFAEIKNEAKARTSQSKQ